MGIRQITADILVDARCALGEAPTWSSAEQRLLWVDIDASMLHSLEIAANDTWTHHVAALAGRVSAVVPASDGGRIAVAGCDVVRLGTDGSFESVIAHLPRDGDGMANDARCDPHGTLWVGTVDRSGQGRGGLFAVSPDGSVDRLSGGIGLANGLDWSPDGSTCYFVDSFTHSVQRFTLDPCGAPTARSTVTNVDGLPDGLTVDCDGAVWVALWDRQVVHRYTPRGALDAVVSVPGGYVTSCAFGGPCQDTLFITTARHDLAADHPFADRAGGLFAADVGISGCPYTPFGGKRGLTPG